jgi:arginine N-succinyltransferase
LPDEVRAAIGAVREESRGAVKLLEQAGMKFLNQIDPFDGGPYYGAPTSELIPVRQRLTLKLRVGQPPADHARPYMVGYEDSRRGFRAVQARAFEAEEGRLVVPPGVIEALGLSEGASVGAVPLP